MPVEYSYTPSSTTPRIPSKKTRPPRPPPPRNLVNFSNEPRRLQTTFLGFPSEDYFHEEQFNQETSPPKKSFDQRLNELVFCSNEVDLDKYSSELIMGYVDSTSLLTKNFKQEMQNEKIEYDKMIDNAQEKSKQEHLQQLELHKTNQMAMDKEMEETARIRQLERDAYNKQRDLEFKELVRIQKEEYRDTLQRIREKREACQRETEKLHLESQRRMHQFTQALLQCLIMKQNFEIEEEKWSNWLKIITDSIARAKNEFSRIEIDLRSDDYYYNEQSETRTIIVDEKSLSLHRVTLAAYDTCYDAWLEMKNLSEKFPDKNFISILKINLGMVSNKLFNCLSSIDSFLEDKATIENIFETFSHINTYDVLSTSELREMSKNSNLVECQNTRNPVVYRKVSNIHIEEVTAV